MKVQNTTNWGNRKEKEFLQKAQKSLFCMKFVRLIFIVSIIFTPSFWLVSQNEKRDFFESKFHQGEKKVKEPLPKLMFIFGIEPFYLVGRMPLKKPS